MKKQKGDRFIMNKEKRTIHCITARGQTMENCNIDQIERSNRKPVAPRNGRAFRAEELTELRAKLCGHCMR